MIVYKENKTVNEPKKRTCVKCKSELGIESSDITKYEEVDLSNERYFVDGFVDGFVCPVCSTLQRLN